MTSGTKNVVFFHPDLGIGGAERLVVDAAVALQNRGHKVTIFTSHCDPSHCFDEARDGTLDVRVRGNTVIPPSFLSRLTILCAILRQVHLILQTCLLSDELADLKPDAFFADQLSACVPLLRFFFPKVPMLFYCHFPDKLLAYRESTLKKIYRVPFDAFEEWSTGISDVIAVNSKFTRGIFGDAFPALKSRQPAVIYPCVDVDATIKSQSSDGTPISKGPREMWKGKRIVLSINRFERKKDVGLAIKAFARLPEATKQVSRLVVAGGYDPRMAENVQHHKELEKLADSMHLKHATAQNLATALAVPDDTAVLFLLSVPSSLKTSLLQAASLLVYTPKYEHFGIVPLEAMLERVPVLAAATGGPPETVVDGKTGWLRDVEVIPKWTAVMQLALADMSAEEIAAMGEQSRRRVVENFSQATMGERLDTEIMAMIRSPNRRPLLTSDVGVIVMVAVSLTLAALSGLVLTVTATR